MTDKTAAGSKGSRHKARRSAVQALYQWQVTKQAPGEIDRQFMAEQPMDGVDISYFHHLVREVPSHQDALDARLAPHLDRALAEVDPVERAILRIGAFELEFHPEIPYRVVLNEAVELAKTFGAEHGHKYVNAVLDRLATALRTAETDDKRPTL
jgi:transcription antitermination protein NusB